MTDPKRILDDPDAPAGLRSLLSNARDDGLGPSGVARVQERLAQSIGQTGFERTGMSTSTKVLAVIAIGGLVAGALALGSGDDSVAERPVPAPTSAVSTVAEPPAPAVSPSAPTPTPTPSLEPPVAPVAEDESPTAEKPRAKAPARKKPQSEGEDVKLLLSARRALPRDPSGALRLTKRHASEFPHSTLAEERELIAIRALVELGRTAEAERRARAFVSAHPRSSHRPAVEAAIRAAKAKQP